MATVSDIATIPAEMDDILVGDNHHEKHAVSEKHAISEKHAVSEKQLASDNEIESGSSVELEDYGN